MMARRFDLGLFVLFLAAGSLAFDGCQTPVGVKRVGREAVYRESYANVLSDGNPSQFSIQILQRNDLLDLWNHDHEKALEELLQAAFRENPMTEEKETEGIILQTRDISRDQLFALAELAMIAAAETGSRERFLSSVLFAYSYLFHPGTRGFLSPFDPRFRMAADIYNGALTEFLRTDGGNLALRSETLKLPHFEIEIRPTRPGFPWGPEEFDLFESALDFRIRGLTERNRIPGLGAPLIALRSKEPNPDLPPKPGTKHLTPRAMFPATAFLRPIRRESAGKGFWRIETALELYATFNVHEIEVAGNKVPLEGDLTAPIAYALQKSKVWDFELKGLLSDSVKGFSSGLFTIEPYVPGKIPVVLVHGTASSPARWAEMLNGLSSYQELRERFQFWIFIYTTGNPIIYSASLLRKSLEGIVQDLDPEKKDPALRRMVLAGHSQGGLLVKLQCIDTKDSFSKRLDSPEGAKMGFTEEQKARLREFFVLKPLPFVGRTVFISTPHRGSFLAAKWYSKIGSALIGTPRRLAKDLLKREGAEIPKELLGKIPTSIQNMDPSNEFIKTLASIPIDPSVRAHSIIAVKGSGPPEGGNDGVVEYKSAHIEEACSEFVVRSGHSCQSHPRTIMEMRRILREEIGEGDAPSPPAAAVKMEPR